MNNLNELGVQELDVREMKEENGGFIIEAILFLAWAYVGYVSFK